MDEQAGCDLGACGSPHREGWYCTLKPHAKAEPHVAHGFDRRPMASWLDGEGTALLLEPWKSDFEAIERSLRLVEWPA